MQKERRIIDTLEPVMNRHKLVIDPQVIEKDWETAIKYEQSVRQSKMLIYQMTRITTERGSLRHDDRLDALAIGVGYWVESMARDEQEGITKHKQDLLDMELQKFMDNAVSPTGMKASSGGGWMRRYTSVG